MLNYFGIPAYTCRNVFTRTLRWGLFFFNEHQNLCLARHALPAHIPIGNYILDGQRAVAIARVLLPGCAWRRYFVKLVLAVVSGCARFNCCAASVANCL